MEKNLFKNIVTLRNKKVLVMGLGLNGGGVGVAKFFAKQGAQVLVTDKKTEKELKESLDILKKFKKIKYTLGRHEEENFLWADLVIKNPDVPNSSPYLEIARKNNIPIETDLTLFFKLSKAFIIGITGTKGKTTTTTLIYHILKQKYKRIFLAGNMGVTPLEFLPKIKKGDKVVLELSSFGLEDLKKSPQIAVMTNIMPDHLNRYATIAEYVEAKKNIFKHQKKNDYLVLNGEDLILKKISKETNSKIVFSSKEKLPGDLIKKFQLIGAHNLENLSLAVEVAKIMKVPQKYVEKAVKSFKAVPNRQEFVGEYGGIKYYNDTTATIPEAVISAISALSEKFSSSNIFLICGGVYKGVEYKNLAQKIIEKNIKILLLPGSGSDKLRYELSGYKNINEVFSMNEAVVTAKKMARAGDIVLLSPGASSFNMFKNEFDRAKKFMEAVKKKYDKQKIY